MPFCRARICLATLTLLAGCTRQAPSLPQSTTAPATPSEPMVTPLPHAQATHDFAVPAKAPAPRPAAKPSQPLVIHERKQTEAAKKLDLTLQEEQHTSLFDRDFNANQQNPYSHLFNLNAAAPPRNFSISGDVFWDEEKLKQEEVNYLDAIKGGEISVEFKTR